MSNYLVQQKRWLGRENDAFLCLAYGMFVQLSRQDLRKNATKI